MPGQFLSPEGDLEEHFITNHWLIDQYIGDQLWMWGSNSYGQLGRNDTITRSTPVQEFTSSTNWKQVSAGHSGVAAIKTDGTLWAWGSNFYGETGINRSGGNVLTPVQEFTSSTNWKFVVRGADQIAAIKTDGSLWLWGSGSNGVLGTNDVVSRSTPSREFTSSNNWKHISLSDTFGWGVAAVKTDGTLWVWGYNNLSQLGINSGGGSRLTPIQEWTSSTNWVKTGAVGQSKLGIKENGQLWFLGGVVLPDAGGRRSTPGLYSSKTNWKDVNVRGFILTSDRQLYRTSIPFDDGTLSQELSYSNNWKSCFSGVTGLNAAFEVFSGVKTDGTLWSWGSNYSGAVGNNSSIYRSTPVQEFTLSTNWKEVSVGGFANTAFVAAIKTGIEMDTDNLTS